MKKDLFISHSSSDKDEFVCHLVAALLERGALSIWYDEIEIAVGDSISEKIEVGLRNAKYIVVVISKSYVKKYWTDREFKAAQNQRKKIIPILHKINHKEFERYAFGMSDLLCIPSSDGPDSIADTIILKLSNDRNSNYSKNISDWQKKIEFWNQAFNYALIGIQSSKKESVKNNETLEAASELFYLTVNEIKKIRKSFPYLTDMECSLLIVDMMKRIHLNKTEQICPYTIGLKEVEKKLGNTLLDKKR